MQSSLVNVYNVTKTWNLVRTFRCENTWLAILQGKRPEAADGGKKVVRDVANATREICQNQTRSRWLQITKSITDKSPNSKMDHSEKRGMNLAVTVILCAHKSKQEWRIFTERIRLSALDDTNDRIMVAQRTTLTTAVLWIIDFVKGWMGSLRKYQWGEDIRGQEEDKQQVLVDIFNAEGHGGADRGRVDDEKSHAYASTTQSMQTLLQQYQTHTRAGLYFLLRGDWVPVLMWWQAMNWNHD